MPKLDEILTFFSISTMIIFIFDAINCETVDINLVFEKHPDLLSTVLFFFKLFQTKLSIFAAFFAHEKSQSFFLNIDKDEFFSQNFIKIKSMILIWVQLLFVK